MQLTKSNQLKSGEYELTFLAPPEEAEALLQFAVNALLSAGYQAMYADDEEDEDNQLDLFDTGGLPN